MLKIEWFIIHFRKKFDDFDWNFEVWAVQKYANLGDRVKSFPTSIHLQKSVSIQPRKSLEVEVTWREIRNLHATGDEILTQISKYLYFEMRAKKRSRRHPSCRARTREEACGVHTSGCFLPCLNSHLWSSMVKRKRKRSQVLDVRAIFESTRLPISVPSRIYLSCLFEK